MHEEVAPGIYLETFCIDNDRRFILRENGGALVGQALFNHLTFFEDTYVHFTGLDVIETFRGKGFGRLLLLRINNHISMNDFKGILKDEIMPEEPAYGMYERHGWIAVDGFVPWRSLNVRSEEAEELEEVISRVGGLLKYE